MIQEGALTTFALYDLYRANTLTNNN